MAFAAITVISEKKEAASLRESTSIPYAEEPGLIANMFSRKT
jgi:hypothetical protein